MGVKDSMFDSNKNESERLKKKKEKNLNTQMPFPFLPIFLFLADSRLSSFFSIPIFGGKKKWDVLGKKKIERSCYVKKFIFV
jgi:hypothetical protein